jgi:hypothetical protein
VAQCPNPGKGVHAHWHRCKNASMNQRPDLHVCEDCGYVWEGDTEGLMLP